jgi:hypothetical protein
MTIQNVVGVPLGIAQGGTNNTSVTISPTASAWAGWDSNKNLSANNHLNAYTTTATAASTTTLTVSSTFNQFFTGSTTQTVALPVTSTLALGQKFYIVNNSSGVVTVQSSGGNTVIAMAANTVALLTCILTSGTTAASWYAEYEQSSLVLPLSLANGGTGQSFGTVDNAVFSTNGSGAAQLSTTLPSGLTIPGYTVNTNPIIPSGRLTLTSGTPVTTSDVTGASAETIYYTPYKGNQISIYNGTNWTTLTFTETSLSVPATTSTMYDIFAQNSSGSLALVAVAWTNDTTRATAITLQNGLYCESGTLTNLYVGSFRTTGTSGQTEDSKAKRYLWNYFNRTTRFMQANDSTASWTYSSGTTRQADGNTANQLDSVIGVSEDILYCNVVCLASSSGATSRIFKNGIGINSTTTTSATNYQEGNINSGLYQYSFCNLTLYPAVGRTYYPWLERSDTSDTQTFYGSNSFSSITAASGIFGFMWG